MYKPIVKPSVISPGPRALANRVIPALLGAAAVIAGCSDDGTQAITPDASVAPVALTACEGLADLPTAQCGSITVPLDRDHLAAGTTVVAFVLVPRTDQTRPSLGTIVTNPGGPGDSTTNLAGALYAQALAPLLDRRDLLLIDPRGVGRSSPISCPALADPAQVFLPLAQQRSLIGRCGNQLGDEIRYHGSPAIADDFDDVRAALGIDQLDLLGDSYGTVLMATYVQRHPAHVRSVVLSGPYSVNIPSTGAVAASAFRRAVGLVCERTAACAGDTVLADLAALATQLRNTPVVMDVQSGGTTYSVTLDEWQLAGTVARIYQGQPDQPKQLALVQAAAAARTGDLDPVRELVRNHLLDTVGNYNLGSTLFSETLQWATTCHESPPLDFQLSESLADRKLDYDKMLANLNPSDFAPFSPTAWITRASDDSGGCLEWPDDPTAKTPFPPGTLLADVPALVLAGDLDANTPSGSGREAAAQFPRATFVEVAGAGHTPTETAAGLSLVLEFLAQPRTNVAPR